MIVGIAVPTTVESRAATAIPAITPALMSSCSRVIGRSGEDIGRFYAGPVIHLASPLIGH
jgi:hypothetical protein